MAEPGVLELLQRLRAQVCGEPRGGLRGVLPIYEHLLRPSEEEAVDVPHELLETRAKLLTCGQDADVSEAVDRMDRVVERCLEFAEQKQQAPVAVEETMRLLLALAGGKDGDTFVLEDPMAMETTDTPIVEASKRIGDRIRMEDVDLVQRSRALFDKMPVPLEAETLYSANVFSSVGNAITPHRSSLWCPDDDVAPVEGGFLSMFPQKQATHFMGIVAGNAQVLDPFSHSLRHSGVAKRQRDDRTGLESIAAIKTLKSREATQPVRSKEVFFYDATQQVHFTGELRQRSEWGDGSTTLTDNSSWDSDSSLDVTERWVARTYAWEDMGDRVGVSDTYCRPLVQNEKRALRDIVIPNKFLCKNQPGVMTLEMHENDLIEDSVRVLSGVESTVFRRDISSATFVLPETCVMKLRNTTTSATKSVLEVFRAAGTILLRLDLLAIYYSQDPVRGGKTLQAMGTALVAFISVYRERIQAIGQDCVDSSTNKDEDDGNASVTMFVCKTRRLCRLLGTLGHLFFCDEDTFWPLLQAGEFPRGIALLNHLHHQLCLLRVEDTSGGMEDLVAWFLIKSSAPLLNVVNDLISSGKVGDSTDPFDEFDITTWSRNLLERASTGGGDGLFSDQRAVDDTTTEMLPQFMGKAALLITHVSQIQALLRSLDALSLTNPLVNARPISLVSQTSKAVECATQWRSTLDGTAEPPQEVQSQQNSQLAEIIEEHNRAEGGKQNQQLCDNTESNSSPGDIVMAEVTSDGESEDDEKSIVSASASVHEDMKKTHSTRMSLPAVHPFFSGAIDDEDAEVLKRAVAEKMPDPTEFSAFATIVHCCVEIPISIVADKLENVAVDWFRSSLRVSEHLRWLRKLMLMSEGLCMDIFSRDFLLGLKSTTRVNWGLDGRLTSALNLAMIEGSVASDDIAQNFYYKASPALSEVLGSITMTPAVPDLLNEIELVYRVQWPLGFVVTTQTLDYYKRMHRFLLYVRLTSLEMREAWGMLRSIRHRGELSESLERLCGGVIYEMQALLRVFNETFATTVLMAAWSELECAVAKAATLVELRRCHEEYVSTAVRCCFLDTHADTIYSAFTRVLQTAWHLTTFVRGLDLQVTGRNAEEHRVRTLCSDFRGALQALVDELLSVGPDAERSTRELTECLLLRLNFNRYYSAAADAAGSSDPMTARADEVARHF